MKLFELFATLALDTSEFDSGVSQSESKWNIFGEKLSSGISKVGNMAKSLYNGAFGGNLGAWIRNIADEASAAGDKIDKQSQALGMSRQAYQEWNYILSQSGASIDSLGTSMKTLNSAILSDSKDTAEVFDALGLSMTELNGLTQESAFEKVVRAFQQLPAGAEKSALAVKLFGRNGQDLLPLLNSSADSIDEMRARAEELGLIMSDDMIDAAVAYNDALDDMDRTFKAVKYTVGAEFMPVMANMFRNVASYAGKLLNAYKEDGFSGVFKTLASDIGGALSNIPWPTWDQVKEGFKTAWSAISAGASSVMKLVFGENEEGGIKWPSASEVLTSATDWWTNEAWPAIKDIFGIDVDTSEAWRSIETFFSDIRTFVENNQEIVLGFFAALAAAMLVINAPLTLVIAGIALLAANWDKLKDAAGKAWEAVETFFAVTIPQAFIDAMDWCVGVWDSIAGWIESAAAAISDFFGVTIPSAFTSAIEGVANAWNSVTGAINSAITSALNFFGLDVDVGPAVGMMTPTDLVAPGEYATGLDYVPYNEFPARLHEGEAVLTKTEATEWRSSIGSQQGIDTTAFKQAALEVFREGMQGMGVYMDGVTVGHIVAPTVSGDISNLAWAGRYD